MPNPPASPTHAPQQFWDWLVKTEVLQQGGQVVRGEILPLRVIFAEQYGADRSPLASIALKHLQAAASPAAGAEQPWESAYLT